MAELMTSIAMSQPIAAPPIVFADAPTLGHTETQDSPSPVPRASKMSPNAAVTADPAKTADQETPEALASLGLNPMDKPSRGTDDCETEGADGFIGALI